MGAPKPFHICPTVVAGSCEGRCGWALQMEVAIAVEPVNTAVGTCVCAFLATNDCGHVHAPCAWAGINMCLYMSMHKSMHTCCKFVLVAVDGPRHLRMDM